MRAMTENASKRSRTREAILTGARALIARGEPVTVAAAAADQGISRATAYRYFSDPAVLAAEAGLAVELLSYETVIEGAATPRTRALAVSRYIFAVSIQHEAAFRQFLARNLDAWATHRTGERRGARRVDMFNAALKGTKLTAAKKKRLVAALSTATGSEAMIGLYDIARVDQKTAETVVNDIAEALLDRFGVTE